MPDSCATLRQRLQQATRDSHERLHVHPLLAPLGRDDITLNDYAAILAAFYRFYQRHEPRFARIAPRFPREVRPLELLAHDFAVLDLAAPPPEESPVGTPSFAAYLGYLYVKQGSTLGGQVIAKGLERHLGLKRGAESFFFYGAGPETGADWKAFETFLNNHAAPPEESEIIAAAVTMFEDLEAQLDRASAGRWN